jgi:hypothetical protein
LSVGRGGREEGKWQEESSFFEKKEAKKILGLGPAGAWWRG